MVPRNSHFMFPADSWPPLSNSVAGRGFSRGIGLLLPDPARLRSAAIFNTDGEGDKFEEEELGMGGIEKILIHSIFIDQKPNIQTNSHSSKGAVSGQNPINEVSGQNTINVVSVPKTKYEIAESVAVSQEKPVIEEAGPQNPGIIYLDAADKHYSEDKVDDDNDDNELPDLDAIIDRTCNVNPLTEANVQNDYEGVTDFLIKNKTVLQSLDIEEKKLVDYCFSEYFRITDEERRKKPDESDFIGHYTSEYGLLHEDVKSLDYDMQVTSNFFEVWCLLLNKNEYEKQDGKMTRFVFGVTQFLYWRQLVKIKQEDLRKKIHKEGFEKATNLFIEVLEYWLTLNVIGLRKKVEAHNLRETNLFFIPFLKAENNIGGHYTLYVVNTEAQMIQYFNNLPLVKEPTQKVHESVDFAKCLGVAFGSFLMRIKHPKTHEIKNYKYQHVQCDWDLKPGEQNNDCAIYVMLEMRDFQGLKYSCPELCAASSRVLFRAQILSTLLMSNLHDTRYGFKCKVDRFVNNKGKAM